MTANHTNTDFDEADLMDAPTKGGEVERQTQDRADHHGELHPFEIHVNFKSVTIKGHEHTGLEIKQAAINAGVSIQADFVLSEELSHGRSRIVGDDQRIKVEPSSCFEAIPNDDHS